MSDVLPGLANLSLNGIYFQALEHEQVRTGIGHQDSSLIDRHSRREGRRGLLSDRQAQPSRRDGSFHCRSLFPSDRRSFRGVRLRARDPQCPFQLAEVIVTSSIVIVLTFPPRHALSLSMSHSSPASSSYSFSCCLACSPEPGTRPRVNGDGVCPP